MTIPDPTPTPATVVTDIHRALDTAKTDATAVIDDIERLDFGQVATEARQAIHDAIEVAKARIAALFVH